jgi:SulP family sulfate permease
VFLLLVVLFLAPLAAYLPMPAMAGILFVVAWGLVDRATSPRSCAPAGPETGVLLATFVATLTLNLEFAIYIGVLLSLMLYLNRTSRPPLEDVKPADPQHILWLQHRHRPARLPAAEDRALNGSIFFGAVTTCRRRCRPSTSVNPAHRHVLLVASGINFVDLAGAHLLGQEARRRRALGGALYLFNLKDEPMEMLRRSGVADEIGEDNFFRLGDDVFGILVGRLNAEVCRNCTARIFHPCRQRPASDATLAA